MRGRSAPLDAMGERIVLATIVSEDKGFYEHDGVDRQAAIRALAQNARHGRLVSGASTISQQLVKLLDSQGKPRPRSLADKLREAARAQNLEEVMDKRSILEAYMNRLSYGHGLVGPEAAAQGYFGVASADLSWAQAAFLAVLPRAPSYLDPFDHRERAVLRTHALLGALHEAGALSDEDLARARGEAVEPSRPARPMLAPHFTEALRQGGSLAGRDVVATTIDLDLQRSVFSLSSYDRTERQMIELSASASGGGGFPVELVVDGEVVARSAWPYRARIPATLGDHEVVARPADPSLAVQMKASRFSVR